MPLPAPTPGQPAAAGQLTLMAGPLLPSEFGPGCFDAPDGVGAEVRFRSLLSMTEAPGGSVVMAEWAGPNAEHCPTPPRAVRGARGGGLQAGARRHAHAGGGHRARTARPRVHQQLPGRPDRPALSAAALSRHEPGALPAHLGAVQALAGGADGSLYILADGALLKATLEP